MAGLCSDKRKISQEERAKMYMKAGDYEEENENEYVMGETNKGVKPF